jgi:hypothetical protein
MSEGSQRAMVIGGTGSLVAQPRPATSPPVAEMDECVGGELGAEILV